MILTEDQTFRTPKDCSMSIYSLRENTMAYQILRTHENEKSSNGQLKLRMDALVSPDNVYATVIQTARASGIENFSLPFVLTNCHNCLCSIGGTINEDDHIFGLTCAKRYGGIFVPSYQGVIHQYMRETMAKSGAMIMGSDSHTRYGALGTLGIGEGGGELVKQLLGQSYEVKLPQVVAIHLTGKLNHGVGPHDVALALAGALFKEGHVRNKIMEFIGDGIQNLSMDMRLGIDAMTTECASLSSVWESDEKARAFFKTHGRETDYMPMKPKYPAYYDSLVEVDLSRIKPMIALPFHPSNCYTIDDFRTNSKDIIHEVELSARKTMKDFSLKNQLVDGNLVLHKGTVAGCVGGLYENVCALSSILGTSEGLKADDALHIFPASQPVYHRLSEAGLISKLSALGAAVMQPACGPCFGVQDIPSNNSLVMRHITRNFLNREGARPSENQGAGVALMDARSIAATLVNGGVLTPATEIDYEESIPPYEFDSEIYRRRVYNGFGHPDKNAQIVKGPAIADWPEFDELQKHLLLKVVGVYGGNVTTDELVPSGEASAHRSNPQKLATFTLQNRDPGYYRRALEVEDFRKTYQSADWENEDREFAAKVKEAKRILGCDRSDIGVGNLIVAEKIGDGSAREQAASSQRVLGARANIAVEYSTKRFRSNLVNWGMLPLLTDDLRILKVGDYVLFKDIKDAVKNGGKGMKAFLLTGDGKTEDLAIGCTDLSADEVELLLDGGLINRNRKNIGKKRIR